MRLLIIIVLLVAACGSNDEACPPQAEADGFCDPDDPAPTGVDHDGLSCTDLAFCHSTCETERCLEQCNSGSNEWSVMLLNYVYACSAACDEVSVRECPQCDAEIVDCEVDQQPLSCSEALECIQFCSSESCQYGCEAGLKSGEAKSRYYTLKSCADDKCGGNLFCQPCQGEFDSCQGD
jgi:hypothetical protein